MVLSWGWQVNLNKYSKPSGTYYKCQNTKKTIFYLFMFGGINSPIVQNSRTPLNPSGINMSFILIEQMSIGDILRTRNQPTHDKRIVWAPILC